MRHATQARWRPTSKASSRGCCTATRGGSCTGAATLLSDTPLLPCSSALYDTILLRNLNAIYHPTRDIKLENVMLCAEDPHAIKLVDFGLAVSMATLTPDPDPSPNLHLSPSP